VVDNPPKGELIQHKTTRSKDLDPIGDEELVILLVIADLENTFLFDLI